MTVLPARDVAALLVAWRDGDRGTLDRPLPLVHTQLRRVARRPTCLARERRDDNPDTPKA